MPCEFEFCSAHRRAQKNAAPSSRESAASDYFESIYSGIATVPFTVSVPVATGAPVPGCPPPTLTV